MTAVHDKKVGVFASYAASGEAAAVVTPAEVRRGQSGAGISTLDVGLPPLAGAGRRGKVISVGFSKSGPVADAVRDFGALWRARSAPGAVVQCLSGRIELAGSGSHAAQGGDPRELAKINRALRGVFDDCMENVIGAAWPFPGSPKGRLHNDNFAGTFTTSMLTDVARRDETPELVDNVRAELLALARVVNTSGSGDYSSRWPMNVECVSIGRDRVATAQGVRSIHMYVLFDRFTGDFAACFAAGAPTPRT